MKTKFSSRLAGLLTSVVLISGTASANYSKPFPKEGIWRGVFTVSESQVPFNFEFKGNDPKNALLTLINGSRRDEFHVERRGVDSIYVKMNTYDAALVAKIEDNGTLTGEYRSLVPGFRGNSLPFTAEHGKNYRFVEPGKDVAPTHNISGKWEIKTYTKEAVPASIALLKQTGNKLTGVIMTVVGDTRELEGTVQGDEFELSGFTGPSPFIVKGKINDDNSITGEQGFGIYKNLKFDGLRNEKAELPDPYKLTFLKPGYKKLDFTFPDLKGQNVSLSDDKYKGKVVIIETIGTWCPNCTDQTVFLAPWFKKNQKRGVEAIAIGFEQKDDLEYAQYTLGKLKEKYGITYDILFGGIADKKIVAEKLPALNKFVAFPTTIIIDRKGDVREIYTGYTGTVTGKYYEEYEKKFNKVLDELIAEPVPQLTAAVTNAGK
ncbi:peroxiredoxin [Pedobacter cryoconitis]|uniref:peroxiredoxin family protein n=1 Tax=Pedobacter cryoconitis TaxID=188932 RepID=UPI0016188B70|nr:TlpA disulfide reductase family protein [Pedobacter cryoconitis]MBB6269874.1 peroxiredoxin [Pedobacter cryoconitis]